MLALSASTRSALVRLGFASARSRLNNAGDDLAPAEKTKLPTAKQVYVQRFTQIKAARRDAQHAAERQSLLSRARHRGRKARVCLDVVGYAVGLGAPCALAALWFLLLTAKVADWFAISWKAAFVPLWAGLAIALVAFVTGMLTSACSRGSPFSTCYRQHEGDNLTLFGCFSHVAGCSSGRASGCCGKFLRGLWLVTFAVLGFIAFPVAVYAKLDGLIAVNWGVVFLPVWAVFFMWCCVPCVASHAVRNDSVWSVWATSIILAWVPLLAVLIMVVVRLQGKFITSALLLIPFWLVDAVTLLFAVIMTCLAPIDDDEDDRRMETRAAVALWSVLAAAIPAQVLCSLYDYREGAIRPLGILVPLLVDAVAIAAVAAFGARALWRRSREMVFTDTYEARSWLSPSTAGAGIIPGVRRATAADAV